MKIRRALISVSDKTDLVPFARALEKQDIEIFSTGGTLKALQEAGIAAKSVETITGFPEILEGRVKTLHPKIHGALLYRREKKSHASEAKKHGIEAIDLLAVNLYPFEQVTQAPPFDFETAMEHIDIGGPSMLRSAAKNFKSVAVICDPADYAEVIQEIQKTQGKVSEALKKKLACKVFERISGYDRAIADFLQNVNGQTVESHGGTRPARLPARQAAPPPVPNKIDLRYEKIQDLRYGENPHQRAAFYQATGVSKAGSSWRQLHGKELSFNNLLDAHATLEVLREFDAPCACVIKHSNPSGIAEAKNAAKALELAIECDAMSAFGGILGVNRACDLETASVAFDRLKFFEVFVAPQFERPALEFLKKRPNLRLIEADLKAPVSAFDLKFLGQGLLLQDRDAPLRNHLQELRRQLRFVTKVKPSPSEVEDLLFAAKCVKVVKSNAIVITQDRQTVGIGAGQMSRVDAVEIACRKAGYRTEGGLLASDAFFPMPDSIEVAHDYKIKAILQPGGSLRDAEVIEACNRFGIAMVLTGERHFKH